MKYDRIVKATFLDRPNRFLAHVKLEGRIETVHVKTREDAESCLFRGQR